MFPRSLKIGAHVFTLKIATPKELGENLVGDMDPEKNRIRIIRGTTRSRCVEIILHECIHAMLSGYEFKDEETITMVLGEALTSFLADNPRFITEVLRVLSDPKKS